MKKLNKSKLTLFIGLSISFANLNAQDWDTGGNQINFSEYLGANSSSTVPVQFRHEANVAASRFDWYTHDGSSSGNRMTLTRAGWFGLNTYTPSGLLHVSNGTILGTGTTGSNPNLGAGTRLMWIPDKAAFRAGEISNNDWDGTQVGSYSMAFGYDNLASGVASSVCGAGNSGIGNGTFLAGSANTATGNFSAGFGQLNTISAQNSIAAGVENSITGGTHNAVFGYSNEVNGNDCFAQGTFNVINNSNFAGAMGKAIDIIGTATFGIGCFLESHASYAITLGTGSLTTLNPLVNNISNSLMVGFNSDSPTLFVSGGDGSNGSSGNVGIGNITTPTERLDVNGTARLRNMPANQSDAIITGVEVSAAGDYVLNHLAFSGQTSDYLAGDGTWQPLQSGCEWNDGVNASDLTMGFAGACHEGNVGIGTNNPDSRLTLINTFGYAEYTNPSATIIHSGQGSNLVSNTALSIESNVVSGAAGGQYGVRSFTTGGYKNYCGQFHSDAVSVTGDNFGIIGEAYGLSSGYTNGNFNIGVKGFTKHGQYNYGLWAEAQDAAVRNIAIYGKVDNADMDPWAGRFDGKTFCTLGIWSGCDEALKENVSACTSILDQLLAIPVYQYNYTSAAQDALGTDSNMHYGIMAQDVSQHFPSLVCQTSSEIPNDNGEIDVLEHLAVNYTELIPLLIGSIQELKIEINTLNEEIAACCSNDTKSQEFNPTIQSDVKLTVAPSPILYQNTPNPHQGQTVIRYFLPESTSGAEMHFFDTQGAVIRIEPLNQTGLGQINLDASDLANGVYTYALLVNGKVIDMKKMVKE